MRRTALFWLDDALGQLSCVATAGGGGADGWVGQTLAAGVGMAGRAVREGRAVWTPDLLADPRVPSRRGSGSASRRRGSGRWRPRRSGSSGVIRGALGFLDGPGRTFDDSDLRRTTVLAEAVAQSLGGARTAGQ